jgi:putative sterol carrier protein
VEKKMADLPKNREELQAATKGKPDADILAMAKGNEENVIDMILNAMPARFDAAKAGNQSAVFQFDVDTPAGLKTNQVAVEAGKVSIVKGATQKPKVTLKCGLPVFIRMMSGELDGQKAFMSGQLKVSGDVMFSRNVAIWFKA